MNKFKNSNVILGVLAVSTISNGVISNASTENKLFKNNIAISKNSNEKFNINWTSSIGSDKEDKFYNVIQSKDGGFIAVGQSTLTETSGFTTGDGIIVKFNSNGQEVWKDVLEGDETDKYYSVVELSNGSIIALGVSYSTDLGFSNSSRTGRAVIAKYSSEGNREWVKNVDDGSKSVTFKDAVVLSDDSLLVSYGEVDTNIGSGVIEKNEMTVSSILKISKDGNVTWKKNYTDATNSLIISDMKKSSDGKIILTGYSYKENNKNECKLIVAKLDEELNEVWSTIGDYCDSVKGNSITEDSNGEIYVAGEVSDVELTGTDAYLLSFDGSTGEFRWDTFISGNKDESFVSVSTNSKGEIIAVGHTNSPGFTEVENATEIIMAKYGTDGNIGDYDTLGVEAQGIVVNSVFLDKNDNITIAGKIGKNVGDTPCDLINPCLQYDAVLLSVDESLNPPTNCAINNPTLVGKDISISVGQKINPLEYVSIKEEDLKHLEKEITFNTDLEVSDTQYIANKPGEYFIDYKYANECGNVATLKIKVTATNSTCSINPPTITGDDTYTYIIGDDFKALNLIKVDNIDTKKIKDSKVETIDGKSVETIIYESGHKIISTSNVDFKKAGTYNINFKVSNECGEATKDVKVIVQEKKDSSINGTTTEKPQTGDNIIAYAGLGIVAVAGLVAVNKKNKKN